MSFVSDVGFRVRALTHRGNFKKRYDVINFFARRQRARRYLEIGTRGGRTLGRVQVAHKVGVDPNPDDTETGATLHALTSDAFFEINRDRFDLVFIDGLHLAEQVLRDLWNSLHALSPGGVILLHDCSPPSELAGGRDQSLAPGGAWNGDVWKAIAFFRAHQPAIFCRVLDLDYGIGVVAPRDEDTVPELSPELEAEAERFFRTLEWRDLEQNRAELLGLLPDRATLLRELRAAGA